MNEPWRLALTLVWLCAMAAVGDCRIGTVLPLPAVLFGPAIEISAPPIILRYRQYTQWALLGGKQKRRRKEDRCGRKLAFSPLISPLLSTLGLPCHCFMTPCLLASSCPSTLQLKARVLYVRPTPSPPSSAPSNGSPASAVAPASSRHVGVFPIGLSLNSSLLRGRAPQLVGGGRQRLTGRGDGEQAGVGGRR